jgi:hypothetical protein
MYAQEFVAGIQLEDRCSWCKRTKKRNRVGLCRHCNEIRKRVEKLEKATRRKRKPDFNLEQELKIALAEKDSCVGWGETLGSILGQVTDLEHWFCMVATRIARDRKMHYGTATMLGWTFTAEQRQVLAYMFWEIFSADASHNRRSRVIYRV